MSEELPELLMLTVTLYKLLNSKIHFLYSKSLKVRESLANLQKKKELAMLSFLIINLVFLETCYSSICESNCTLNLLM